jgi:hypothetical protein
MVISETEKVENFIIMYELTVANSRLMRLSLDPDDPVLLHCVDQ